MKDVNGESSKDKIQTRNNKDYLFNSEDIHTCSSDEQMKTGEVTLENPSF